jgi:hypothetical protein
LNTACKKLLYSEITKAHIGLAFNISKLSSSLLSPSGVLSFSFISKGAETYFALFGAYHCFSMLADPSSQGVKSSEKREKAQNKFLHLC